MYVDLRSLTANFGNFVELPENFKVHTPLMLFVWVRLEFLIMFVKRTCKIICQIIFWFFFKRTIVKSERFSDFHKKLFWIQNQKWLICVKPQSRDSCNRNKTENAINFTIFFCYWPQNTDSQIFISHLNNILPKVSYKNKKCFVVGDFNMECLKIFSTTTFPYRVLFHW